MTTKAKGSLKYKIGMFFIILGTISPLIGLGIPLLNLSKGITTTLLTFFMVGGPELFLLLGAALAGREAVRAFKGKLFKRASKIRYYVGLSFFVASFLGNLVFTYLAFSHILLQSEKSLFFITVSFDVIGIIGILTMGPEVFGKIKKIFIWEEEST